MSGGADKAFAQHSGVLRRRSGTAETGVVVLITPEVVGSNPTPATIYAGQMPLLETEGAFLLPPANGLAKRPARLGANRQRDAATNHALLAHQRWHACADEVPQP
jgi:hypothetical protein